MRKGKVTANFPEGWINTNKNSFVHELGPNLRRVGDRLFGPLLEADFENQRSLQIASGAKGCTFKATGIA